MKTVLVGLVQGPIAWLAVSAAISYALQVRYGAQAGATIGVSLIAGGCAWAAVGLLFSSVNRWRERAAINGGVAGVRPADGKAAVLVGTIEPTGPVLAAPLDGSPCVTYSYEIHDDRGQGKRRSISPVVRGVALTASTIVTRTGSYRLLVVPQIDAAEPVASRDEMIANFQRYAARTTFTARKGSADELIAQWNDADGEYRSDVAYGPLDGLDTTHWVLAQRHVPPGTRVCVFGRYSQAQGGIVPSAGGPTRLVRGSAEQVAASLRSTAVSRGALGLIFASAAAGVIFLFLA